MKSHTPTLLVIGAALCGALTATQPARACGGLLQPQTGTVSQQGQLGLLVVDQGKTSVVLTLDVPDAANAFGVLVPVPSEPTIDANPVSTDALTALEALTRPVVGFQSDGGGGGGFGCGVAAGADRANGKSLGVVTGNAVNIGPVTAQWLSGTSGAAISDWLTAEGFALPDGAQAIIDGYVNGGLSFLAFTRNETAAGAAKVGVHFSLDGDHRAYALQMTRLGAASSMAFTIFVATADPDGVASDNPYKPITVSQLDQTLIQTDYTAAVKKGVDANGGKAFVIETKVLASDLSGDATLAALIPAGHTITRMSSVLDPANLDADVTFTSKAPTDLAQPAAFGVTAPPSAGSGPGPLGLLCVALAALQLARRLVRGRARIAGQLAVARA